VFLDTVDTPLERERVDPNAFGGTRTALDRVLRHLRRELGDRPIVLNGGLALVDASPELVDAVAVESVWSNYDFAERRYLRRATADAETRVRTLRRLRDRGVSVLTIEYAPAHDRAWVARLITLARDQGFVPYVATIGLDRVHTETLRLRDTAR
jgi:hypothetical protein